MATVPKPLPVIPGVYYSRVRGTIDGSDINNIFAWQVVPAPAAGAADAAAAMTVSLTVGAQWKTFVDGNMSVKYVGADVSTYALGSPIEPAAVAPYTAVGNQAGAMAPLTSAIVVRRTVSRRGKGSQSRSYLTPVPNEYVNADGKTLNATFLAQIDPAFTAFTGDTLLALATASPGTWTQVQVSKLGTGATYKIINNTVEGTLSSQRRRARRA
jgi:hypothetical protein